MGRRHPHYSCQQPKFQSQHLTNHIRHRYRHKQLRMLYIAQNNFIKHKNKSWYVKDSRGMFVGRIILSQNYASLLNNTE